MQEFTGKLSLNGVLIAESVQGWIRKIPDSLPSWDGTMVLPVSVGLPLVGKILRLDMDGAELFDVFLVKHNSAITAWEFQCADLPVPRPDPEGDRD